MGGAGYIGLELAEALCARGIPVTVIQRGRTPMDTLDPDMGGMLAEAMRRFTMTLRLEEIVTGFEAVSVSVDSTTRAGYYPGARPIRTKFVAERGSGRLSGAQIVGEEGAAKRIDVPRHCGTRRASPNC